MTDEYAIGLIDEKPDLRVVTLTYHDDIGRKRRELDMQYLRIALRRRFQATLWGQAGLTLLPPEEDYEPPNRPLKLRKLAQVIAKRLGTLRDMVINALTIQVALENAQQNRGE